MKESLLPEYVLEHSQGTRTSIRETEERERACVR